MATNLASGTTTPSGTTTSDTKTTPQSDAKTTQSDAKTTQSDAKTTEVGPQKGNPAKEAQDKLDAKSKTEAEKKVKAEEDAKKDGSEQLAKEETSLDSQAQVDAEGKGQTNGKQFKANGKELKVDKDGHPLDNPDDDDPTVKSIQRNPNVSQLNNHPVEVPKDEEMFELCPGVQLIRQGQETFIRSVSNGEVLTANLHNIVKRFA